MAAQSSNVLAIKHLPHGFYEQQLLGFFSQFGEVEAVRVRRSRVSGLSCGLGYVKFQIPEVAAIARKSMNGYMLYGETLRVQTKSLQWIAARPNLFRSEDTATAIEKRRKRGFQEERDQRLRRRQKRILDKETTISTEEYVKRCHGMVESDKKLAARIKEMGIDYNYPPLQLTPELQSAWDTHQKNLTSFQKATSMSKGEASVAVSAALEEDSDAERSNISSSESSESNNS